MSFYLIKMERNNLLNFTLVQLNSDDYYDPVNAEIYGFYNYETFCVLQNKIVNNLSEIDVKFYESIRSNLVNNSGVFVDHEAKVYTNKGFFFIYNLRNEPQLIFRTTGIW